MDIIVDGHRVFIATGGQPFDSAKPAVLFLHGAGFDQSTWALQTRWFSHHGFTVIAPDLPAHGRSEGEALRTIAALADWTASLLEQLNVSQTWVIGHSMGSLIALEFAHRHAAMVAQLSLIGTAAAMTVGADLLKAAAQNDHAAIDMVSIWGLGARAELGGSLAPGLWMHASAQRVLERTKQGVLACDLNACNDYTNAPAAAATLTVPTTLILGERDMMTPLKAGKTLASLIKNAHTIVLKGAGHMPMVEYPDELLAALRSSIASPA